MTDSLDPTSFVDQAFIGEVEIEAEYCLAAASTVDRALEAGHVSEIFRALHSLLSHAAMISKFLWPAVKSPKDKVARMSGRAARLRTALALSSTTVAALESRDLRNTLEHFDERLDDWGHASPRGLLDRNIGSPSAFATFDSSMKLRHYDPDTHTYFFGDTPFDIRGIVAAVHEVLQRVPNARATLGGTIS